MDKKVQIQLSHSVAHSISDIIQALVKGTYTGDADKLLMANLAQLNKRLYTRLYSFQKVYKMSLQAHEAIALRMLFTEFVKDYTSQTGAALHNISNQIHQVYQ